MAKRIKLSGKITVEVLVNSFPFLDYLSTQLIEPIAAHRLRLVMGDAQKHLDAYSVARKPIFEKFAKDKQPKLNTAGIPILDAEGEPVLHRRVPVADMEKFKKKLQPVLDEPLKIKIEDIRLRDLSKALLSSQLLEQLDWLIDV